jgi:uncharacterized membrane protein YheB (UPF0754 family)
MTPLQEIFPEKGSLGSMINSFDSVVNERALRLQQYLQELLSHEKIKTDELVLNFLDVANEGSQLFLSLSLSLNTQQVPQASENLSAALSSSKKLPYK